MITKPTTKFALVDTQGVVVDGATEIDVTNDVGSWKSSKSNSAGKILPG